MDGRIRIALDLVEAHIGKPLTATAVAKEVGLSRSRFEHLFKEGAGRSFGSHLRLLRMGHAAELLQDPVPSIKEIAAQCGYSATSHFTRAFVKHFGAAPSQFRRSSIR